MSILDLGTGVIGCITQISIFILTHSFPVTYKRISAYNSMLKLTIRR